MIAHSGTTRILSSTTTSSIDYETGEDFTVVVIVESDGVDVSVEQLLKSVEFREFESNEEDTDEPIENSIGRIECRQPFAGIGSRKTPGAKARSPPTAHRRLPGKTGKGYLTTLPGQRPDAESRARVKA